MVKIFLLILRWICKGRNGADVDSILTRMDQKLDRIIRMIQKEEVIEMAQLDDLKANVAALIADVTAQGTVIGSAVTAIKGLTDQQAVLSQQLAAAIAANDPVAIQAAADAIAAQNQLIISQTTQLAAAIPANTPVAPAP
jgi:hypothetical protein